VSGASIDSIAHGTPFCPAYLPSEGLGTDLAAYGYTEDEYLLSGTAGGYRRGAVSPEPGPAGFRYVTRLLVRQPARAEAFSGRLFFEGLHPSGDRGLTWGHATPWLLRSGHAWAGVTVFRMPAELMRQFDPDRYRRVSLRSDDLRFDILHDAATLLRGAQSPIRGPVRFVYASGWSYTGSLWRTYLAEGFHELGPEWVFDAYLLAISSGASVRGLQKLSEGDADRPAGDPARIVRPHGVPVIELLSESEAEVNWAARRPDSDDAGDPYRLYEIAGAAHINTTAAIPGPNIPDAQLRSKGIATGIAVLQGVPNAFPMNGFAAAVLGHLDAWVAEGTTPPRAGRFHYGDHAMPDDPGAGGARRPLRRDEHGNAIGGVRSPYVDVPTARYLAHSTVTFDGPATTAPGGRLVNVGYLTGSKEPFAPDQLRALYQAPERYRALVRDAAGRLVEEGWLIEPEARQVIAEADAVAF
jgi:hypothetical protein